MLQLQNLSTGYITRKSTVEISKHMNAELKPGTFTCLLGTNGGGKSTLLRTLAGYQVPLGGDILYDSKSLADMTDAELSRTIAVVLTERPVLPNSSVWEVVAMGRHPYTGFWGRLTDNDRNITDRAMMNLHIRHLAYRMIDTLSDGERQKVMIAKALAQDTPVILLDEPTAFLDYPSKIEINTLLKKIASRENKIVLQSTHDIPLALRLADNIWLLDRRIGFTEISNLDNANLLLENVMHFFGKEIIRYI